MKFLLAILLGSVASGQTVQTTFEFHSGFWVNLHHVLYNQASGRRAGRTPDLSALTSAETADWNAAIDYYERWMIDRDLLERGMTRINQALSRESLKSPGAPATLLAILNQAAPVYRAHWWEQHDRKNREWIQHVTPQIAASESTLRPAFARACHTSWPKARLRVEMSYYTTGASAYTSLFPTLITISSWSQRNVGSAALETIFHEAGHSLLRNIRRQMRGRKLAHGDLWHAILFYTTGELVRRQLPDLVPYAIQYGMWERNWPNTLPLMEKDWKPFLDGRGRFQNSLDAC